MNRSFLAALAILVALAPVSLAQAQTHSHAGMSMQDHAAMQAPASDVTTAPADNAMLAAAPPPMIRTSVWWCSMGMLVSMGLSFH